jgi:hypothetical protein
MTADIPTYQHTHLSRLSAAITKTYVLRHEGYVDFLQSDPSKVLLLRLLNYLQIKVNASNTLFKVSVLIITS